MMVGWSKGSAASQQGDTPSMCATKRAVTALQ